MKTVLKLEEVGLFLLSVYLFSQLSFAWWWFPALLLTPDMGMIGYAFNSRIGAYTYNILHHRLTATLLAICGLSFQNEYLQLAALILFAHISMDRIFGYGLKYTTGFKQTHLKTLN